MGAPKCKLCHGSGENRSGYRLAVNDDICTRCGGYGTVPSDDGNEKFVTESDIGYMRNNGIVRAPSRVNADNEGASRD